MTQPIQVLKDPSTVVDQVFHVSKFAFRGAKPKPGATLNIFTKLLKSSGGDTAICILFDYDDTVRHEEAIRLGGGSAPLVTGDFDLPVADILKGHIIDVHSFWNSTDDPSISRFHTTMERVCNCILSKHAVITASWLSDGSLEVSLTIGAAETILTVQVSLAHYFFERTG